jgi:competence protein ComEA
MSNIKEKAWLIISSVLVLSIITGIIVFFIRSTPNQAREITVVDIKTNQSGWNVYIEGAVKSPGGYTLNEDDTVINLIAASGLSPEANTNAIKIYVPRNDEINRPQKVSLNRADAWLIAALPGLGTEKAKSIVDYRAKNGPFNKIEELLNIKGIGKTIVENIRDLVTLTE